MAVYVDDMAMAATVGKIKGRWSHLMADTHDELVTFAKKIGLRESWIQHEGTPMEHFDVTASKREAALKAGAVALHDIEGGYLTRAKSKGEKFDLEVVRAHRASMPKAGEIVTAPAATTGIDTHTVTVRRVEPKKPKPVMADATQAPAAARRVWSDDSLDDEEF